MKTQNYTLKWFLKGPRDDLGFSPLRGSSEMGNRLLYRSTNKFETSWPNTKPKGVHFTKTRKGIP